jgi:hypothetical protein
MSHRDRLIQLQTIISQETQQGKPLTIRQAARRVGLSVARTRQYILELNEKLRKQSHGHAAIQRVNNRYLYLTTPEPERPQELAPGKGRIIVRGYVYYASTYRSRNIDINCIAVTQHDPRIPPQQDPAVVGNMDIIRNLVKDKFGEKLAGILNFGFEEATPYSHNRYVYKHAGGPWIDF